MPPPAATDLQHLQSLMQLLRSQVSVDFLRTRLTAEFTERADVLLAALGDASLTGADRRRREYELAATAMAWEPLERSSKPVHNPLAPPSFMQFAKVKLAEYIIADPRRRKDLRRSIFFGTGKRHVQRLFANRVSKSVGPLNYYEDDGIAYAADWVSGGITLDLN